MEILEWIQNWYASQCDDDWEHQYGVKIDTLDNPGWAVKIDLAETELENAIIEYKYTQISDNEWYSISIKDGVYDAAGDPNRLIFLLEKFKTIVETDDRKHHNL